MKNNIHRMRMSLGFVCRLVFIFIYAWEILIYRTILLPFKARKQFACN
ncbi:Uncharacterised protein [Klebsiella pneumoniae]|nr:Uncharacterised protein [Klebsiella pneumoniae]SWI96530.1 Uncharacterised protein [Klebsiella pneumoniae]